MALLKYQNKVVLSYKLCIYTCKGHVVNVSEARLLYLYKK